MSAFWPRTLAILLLAAAVALVGPDLASANQFSSNAAVLLGNGDDSFGSLAASGLSIPPASSSMVVMRTDGMEAPSLIPMRVDSTLAPSGQDGEGTTGMKSETGALLWSLLGTVVPVAASAPFVWTPASPSGAAVLLVGAVIIGPSLGHFYAARPGVAFAGIGVRLLAGAGVAVGGLASTSEGGATSGSNAMAAIGAIVGGASIVWDILRAPHSARVHNNQVRQGRISLRITPSVHAGGLGLCAVATF